MPSYNTTQYIFSQYLEPEINTHLLLYKYTKQIKKYKSFSILKFERVSYHLDELQNILPLSTDPSKG